MVLPPAIGTMPNSVFGSVTGASEASRAYATPAAGVRIATAIATSGAPALKYRHTARD